MNSYYGVTRSSEYLAHYGVKGMKWGVRKYYENKRDKHLAKAKEYSQIAKERSKLSKTANNKYDQADRNFEADAYRKAAKRQMKRAKRAENRLRQIDRFKNRKYFTNQDFKDAFKAGLVGAAFGPYAGLGYTVTKQNQRIANEIPANNNRHGKRNRRS